MSNFWSGFEKAAAANPMWAASAFAKAKNLFGAPKRAVQGAVNAYQQKAQNPLFRTMRAASIGTMGLGGTAYGLNRLARSDVQEMGPHPAQGYGGPAM